MAMLQNVDVNLKELVEDIEKGNFLIPKFQRDFVWKVPDIENLGDSIIRGYPISSMLMMPVNGTLKVAASSLKTAGAQINGSSQIYVLDGQQRLTSIAKLFLSFDDAKEYYFDMLSILCDAFPEDEIPLMSAISRRISDGRQNRKSGFSDITPELCRSFKKSATSTTDTRQEYRFIKGRDIIDNRYAVRVNKFLRVFEYINDDLLEKYTNHLTGVFGNISGYGVPVTKINADADLGLVVRVFEKVNSSGKKLTLFDLINAKSFETNVSAYQVGLSDFILTDLKSTLKNKDQSGINDFFEIIHNGEEKSSANLARFIRSYSIANLLEKGIMPGITNADMLAKEPNFWFDGWTKSKEVILEFIDWLKNEELLDQANLTFAEYICGILINNRKLLQETSFMNEVKRYILYINISGIGFSKTNLDVVLSFNKFGKNILSAHEFEKHRNSFMDNLYLLSELTPERVVDWNQGRKQFKAMMYIMYTEKFGGKFNIDLLGNAIKSLTNTAFDEHHIIPKAQTKGENDKIFSSIANFVLLSSSSNRNVIKDKHPSVYLELIKNTNPVNYDYIIRQNMLEGFDKITDNNSAIEALKKRLEDITAIVQSYFKRHVA